MELNLVPPVFVSVFRGLKDIDVNAVKTVTLGPVATQLPNAAERLTTLNFSSQVALKLPNCENDAKLKLTIAVANILPSFVKLKGPS